MGTMEGEIPLSREDVITLIMSYEEDDWFGLSDGFLGLINSYEREGESYLGIGPLL